MTLCGYHIPKGTFVGGATMMSSMDERFFHDPDMFLPERWDRSNRDDNFNAFASTPFGHGPRSCIGKRIAQAELYVLAVKILQKYRLVYEGEQIGLVTTAVNKPDRDLVFKLVNRN